MDKIIDVQNPMKKPQLIVTKDGSHSLWVPDLKESYHSTYGAIRESEHVFVRHGLLYRLNNKTRLCINILEIGLGTGLNVLLTYLTSLSKRLQIVYTGLEPYPIPYKYVQRLNYAAQLTQQKSYAIAYKDLQATFERLHLAGTMTPCRLSDRFMLKKSSYSLQAFSTVSCTFDIIYFDAFSPNKQPDMWSMDMLKKVYQMLRRHGILVTYCAQSQFRRRLQHLGMHVETLPGPPGKREMIRAQKQK